MRVESHGQVKAVSPKGAIGLMQIMPDTWAGLRLRYRLGRDPHDPRDNILAGAAYLREMHDRFGAAGFLAAYNAGPGRYAEYLAAGRPLPAETRAYVAALAPLIGGDPVRPRRRDRSRCHRMDTCATVRCGCRQHLIRTSAAIGRSIARTSGCRSLRAGTDT